MSYPGNSSLSNEIRERLLNTFRQALDLAGKGNREEAKLGCDFILRMDPMFDPARELLERINKSSGSVDVSGLSEAAPGGGEHTSPNPAHDADLLWGEDGSDLGSELQAELGQDDADDIFSVAPGTPSVTASASESPAGDGDAGLSASELEALGSSLDATAFDDGSGSDSAPSLGAIEEQPSTLGALDEMPATDLGGMDGLGGMDLGDSEAADTDDRIQALLDEGQTALDRSEHQAAIDAWSRIFLINVDHAEATRRIEEARKLKAESERQVDEIFHEGLAHLDGGRRDEARQCFETALALQPSHLAAKDYLQQIESGAEISPTRAPAPPTPAPAAAPMAPMDGAQLPDLDALAPTPGAGADSDLPPLPFGEEGEDVFQPESAPVAAAAVAQKLGRSFVLIGGVVFALVLVVGWFLYSRWGSLFPNSEDAPPATAGSSPPRAGGLSPIQRAIKLRQAAKTDAALETLRKVPQGDPDYDQAQTLISQWDVEPEPEPPPPDVEEVDLEAERMARREALLERARKAYSEREYLQAAYAFRDATAIAPLEGSEADFYEDTKLQLKPVAAQIELYRQREWELALPTLWRKLDEDADDRVVARLLANSYYNLGLRSLRRDKPAEAVDKFDEALSIKPEDEATQRLRAFAETYKDYPPDLLYQVFVKNTEFRE